MKTTIIIIDHCTVLAVLLTCLVECVPVFHEPTTSRNGWNRWQK